MEMLRSLRGDKHEFCLTVIKSKHVHSFPSFDINCFFNFNLFFQLFFIVLSKINFYFLSIRLCLTFTSCTVTIT